MRPVRFCEATLRQAAAHVRAAGPAPHCQGHFIAEPGAAEEILQRINYYRLSGYWHPCKQPSGDFWPGTSLDEIVRLYEFDRALRGLVVDALERFEVQLRTAVAYTLAHAHGPFSHEQPASFDPWPGHAACITHLRTETQRSRETFVQHHSQRYVEYPALPVWVAVEVMSLGNLSHFYAAMQRQDRRDVAQGFGVHHDVFRSWIHTLTYVRNICAHHARLWNRGLAIKPDLPRKEPLWGPPWVPGANRIYCVLLILRQLTRDHHHAADDWAQAAMTHLRRMDGLPLRQRSMGMPADWANHPLWKL